MLRLFTRTLLLCTLFAGAADLAPAQGTDLSAMSDQQFVDYLRDVRTNPARSVQPGAPGVSGSDKCGFGISAEAARRLPTMPPGLADDVLALMRPAARQTSILSPSGRFRIHFDTTGTHAAAMLDASFNPIPNSAREYADSAAAIFDEVFRIQVENIGYAAPPFEEVLTEYQIYVLEFNGSIYGQTNFNLPLPNSGTVKSTYASSIELDNDFRRYETRGLDGLRVTAAHEFHHMVQIGSYGLWLTDRWMHEMVSTYYEELCYPEANDYLQYVRQFMQNTDRSIWAWGADGYPLVLWPIYLEHRYGVDLMRQCWEGMRQIEPITALRDAVRDHQPVSGDLASDFCGWGKANFFTSYRSGSADPQAYADAEKMPRPKLQALVELIGESASFSGVLPPFATHYARVYRGIDTLSFAVSNTDVQSAIERKNQAVSWEIEVRRSGYDGSYIQLDNGWAYRFTAAVPNTMCVDLLEGGTAEVVDRTAPYPNPFNPRVFSRMQFPVPRDVPKNRADLLIFTVSMDLVVKKENVPIELDDNTGAFVGWDGREDGGDFLGSGVYFYVLNIDGEVTRGKFAVVER